MRYSIETCEASRGYTKSAYQAAKDLGFDVFGQANREQIVVDSKLSLEQMKRLFGRHYDIAEVIVAR